MLFVCVHNLGDFGISKVLASTLDAGKTFAGTPFYLAPEMCEDKPYTSKADVWVIIYLNFIFDQRLISAEIL